MNFDQICTQDEYSTNDVLEMYNRYFYGLGIIKELKSQKLQLFEGYNNGWMNRVELYVDGTINFNLH